MARYDRATVLNGAFALLGGLVVAVLGMVLVLVFVGLPSVLVSTDRPAPFLLAVVAGGGAMLAVPLYVLFDRTALGPTVPGR